MQRSKARDRRPRKPYADFPLFPHRNGCWAKKIRGRFVFFGPWGDAEGALQRYLAQRDELHAGRADGSPPGAAKHRATGKRATLATSDRALGAGTNTLNGAQDAARANVAQPVANPLAPAAAVLSPEVPLLRLAGTPKTATIGGGGGDGGDGITLRDLANAFLTAKQRRVDAGEMGLRSFSEQYATAGELLKFLGKHRLVQEITPDDFSRLRALFAKTRGPVALGNQVGRVRSIFKFAFDMRLIDRPVRFGPEFSKPSKKSVRLARRASGLKMFEAGEIQALLENAGAQMKAMILLGINCGLGNTDVGELSKWHVSLKHGFLDFPRPKTGIARRCVLWPETVAALRMVSKVRPQPRIAQDKDMVFITKARHRWVRVTEPGSRSQGKQKAVVKDAVAAEFTKVLAAAGVASGEGGRGFYALRHTFRTVADEVGDRRAIDLIMGHENGADIATHYVERIDDERLRRVVEHVREWLFTPAAPRRPAAKRVTRSTR
jgi:integrase